MDKKYINKKDLKNMKIKKQDQIKIVYQVTHGFLEIYQDTFSKQSPHSIFIDLEKIKYLETIENNHLILPSYLLFDSKTNQYLGYETNTKNYKELKTILKSSKNYLDSLTDYYLQIHHIIKESHQHHIVIPSLFWDTHLLIDTDNNEIYCTNLVHAQINEFPAMIVDPKLYLLHQQQLPNIYQSQFINTIILKLYIVFFKHLDYKMKLIFVIYVINYFLKQNYKTLKYHNIYYTY